MYERMYDEMKMQEFLETQKNNNQNNNRTSRDNPYYQ